MMRFLMQRGVTLRRHEVHLGEYGADSRKTDLVVRSSGCGHTLWDL